MRAFDNLKNLNQAFKVWAGFLFLTCAPNLRKSYVEKRREEGRKIRGTCVGLMPARCPARVTPPRPGERAHAPFHTEERGKEPPYRSSESDAFFPRAVRKGDHLFLRIRGVCK